MIRWTRIPDIFPGEDEEQIKIATVLALREIAEQLEGIRIALEKANESTRQNQKT